MGKNHHLFPEGNGVVFLGQLSSGDLFFLFLALNLALETVDIRKG